MATKILSSLLLSLTLAACGEDTATVKDGTLPSVKGERGSEGDQGEQGLAGIKGDQGEKGEQGERGEKGDKGDDGADGKDGEDGERGEKGDAGEAAPQLRVLDADGSYIGKLVFVGSNGQLNVVNGSMRMEISVTLGSGLFRGRFFDAQQVYSGLNCTGEMRLIGASKFSNVFVDTRDFATVWQVSGGEQGAFVQASKFGNGTCQNAAQNHPQTWKAKQITVPFPYPFVFPQIENSEI